VACVGYVGTHCLSRRQGGSNRLRICSFDGRALEPNGRSATWFEADVSQRLFQNKLKYAIATGPAGVLQYLRIVVTVRERVS
jgi:hypothetical protein